MITLRVNGKTHKADADPDIPLLWVLRDHLGLTSVKYTCGVSECGLCTVLVDGQAQRSCFVSVAQTADLEQMIPLQSGWGRPILARGAIRVSP